MNYIFILLGVVFIAFSIIKILQSPKVLFLIIIMVVGFFWGGYLGTVIAGFAAIILVTFGNLLIK